MSNQWDIADSGDVLLEDNIERLLEEPEATEDDQNIQTSLDEKRINEPFGDSHLYKNPDHDRWYIQNVNGINTDYNWMEWRTQMHTLHEAKVDGFSFTETNLRWTPEQTQEARQCGRHWFKQFRVQPSSSNDPTTRASYQPGGTCSGVTNKLAGRITHQGSDPSGLGRWSYFCLEGKQIDTDEDGHNINRKVNIITAYLVAQHDSASPGHDTAFMQQKRLLTLSGNTNPKPRKQGFLDLTKQIKAMQKDDADVLLLTDANADILDPDFQLMIKETGA